jgi:hypothetical protein
MRLDTTQLPKPFQLTAITSREWTLTSDWKRFAFAPSTLPATNHRADEATQR